MTTQKHSDDTAQSTYIPVSVVIPGNSAPHNPMSNNPLRDPVSPPVPQK